MTLDALSMTENPYDSAARISLDWIHQHSISLPFTDRMML